MSKQQRWIGTVDFHLDAWHQQEFDFLWILLAPKRAPLVSETGLGWDELQPKAKIRER
jgi:hypothetical protein